MQVDLGQAGYGPHDQVLDAGLGGGGCGNGVAVAAQTVRTLEDMDFLVGRRALRFPPVRDFGCFGHDLSPSPGCSGHGRPRKECRSQAWMLESPGQCQRAIASSSLGVKTSVGTASRGEARPGRRPRASPPRRTEVTVFSGQHLDLAADPGVPVGFVLGRLELNPPHLFVAALAVEICKAANFTFHSKIVVSRHWPSFHAADRNAANNTMTSNSARATMTPSHFVN